VGEQGKVLAYGERTTQEVAAGRVLQVDLVGRDGRRGVLARGGNERAQMLEGRAPRDPFERDPQQHVARVGVAETATRFVERIAIGQCGDPLCVTHADQVWRRMGVG